MKWFVSFFAVFSITAPPSGAAAERKLTFNRDIRPILSDNCFACHGFDPSHRKAKLRLDTPEGAYAERNGLHAIVPGKLEESEVWHRIISTDEDEVMPPADSHKKLTAAQKDVLKRWIEQGAPYESHWAYAPIAKVSVPTPKRADWARTDIDRFILSRLEAEGLQPSPEAPREILIRRLSLDLTGLPPTPKEVHEFVADRSPTAYERVVSRLLKSPHYGERMAVDWLDAARYADSYGYQNDGDRTMWPWRDWVIRAFNDNMPFDRFTLEQLAGDLLPNPTLEQRIATGFNRNHMINGEDGIIQEEFMAEYIADRVETTGAVWLAQTMNCTRCHDHKYDPLTQRDFYSLKAFFNNVPEGSETGKRNLNMGKPSLTLPSAEIDQQLIAPRAELAEAERKLAAFSAAPLPGQANWLEAIRQAPAVWLRPEVAEATWGLEPLARDASQAVALPAAQTALDRLTAILRLTGEPVTALKITVEMMDLGIDFFHRELEITPIVAGKRGKLIKLRPVIADDATLFTEASKLFDRDGNTNVRFDVTPQKPATMIFALETPLASSGGDSLLEIKSTLYAGPFNKGGSRWRFETLTVPVEHLVPTEIKPLLAKSASALTAKEQLAVNAAYAAHQPEYLTLRQRRDEIQQTIGQLRSKYPTVLVMEEMVKPRDTFILLRGVYDKPGDKVSPNTPAILPPMNPEFPQNRLGLARWLVSPENPLTSRVTVNRLWQQVFGTGLVKSSDNFGSQGDAPSHPELLDWLATEFMRSGWDVQHMLRLMVTSATYRQQSQIPPLLAERDPENVLLARGPRFRLMGEFIRDQALAASGLLVDKIGGPPVRPYHPKGLYEQLGGGKYVQGTGDDLYRRSLYTFWKRSVPHPAMLSFGTPFREACTLQRPRSNTATQALNLLNDETYVEAARVLGSHMLGAAAGDCDAGIREGFQRVLARPPAPQELAVLRRGYDRAHARFSKEPDSAKALLQTGASVVPEADPIQLAAYTLVANTLLNLDETVTKP